MGLFDGIVKGVSGFFGGGTPPPYQTPQRIQNFMQPIPTTEMQAAGHYQNLLDDKQGYDASQQQIDAWNKTLANPDLTDEQRQQATNAVQNWTAYRDAYAQDAENTRKSAAAIGLDVSDYGTDKTLQQSQQAFLTHKNLAVQKFLNDMPTLGELEENRYRELRSRGASPSMANSIVADERGKMNSMLARRLGDFMTTYGKNPDGTIDQDLGIMAMTRVLPDPQSVAQLFAQGFAMPSKVFDANQQLASHLALANANNAAAMDRTKWSGENQLLMSREGIAARNEQLAKTIASQEHENELNRLFQDKWKMMELTIKSAGSGSGKNGGDNMWQEITNLANLWGYSKEGVTDEEKTQIWSKAAEAWTRQKYPNIYKANTNEYIQKMQDLMAVGYAKGLRGQELLEFVDGNMGFETKGEEKAKETNNLFKNDYTDIENAIKAGNKQAALEGIGAMRERLATEDYKKLLDNKTYGLHQKKLDILTKQVNGEYDSEDGIKEFIRDRYYVENEGVYPTQDDILNIMRKDDYYGMPTTWKKKIKTPTPTATMPNTAANTSNTPYSFNVAPLNSPTQNSASMGYGYGTGAYTPPPR